MNRKQRKEVRSIQRQLTLNSAEKLFIWSSPVYQKAHMQVLKAEEEKLLKKLEELNG